MRTKISVLALSTVVALGAGCSKAPTAPPGGPASAASIAAPASVAPAVPAEAAPEEKLAWLQGSWCGHDEDQQIEETWMRPQGGESIGMSRTVQGRRIISYEFMRIAEPEGKLTLFAQPSGEAATPFERTDGGDDWIRFENKKHDYPQRIEYRKAGDKLHAEIGGPGEPGKEAVIAYDYTRCK